MRLLPVKAVAEIIQSASRVFADKEELNNFLQKNYWNKQSGQYDFHFEPFRPDGKTILQYKEFIDSKKNKSRILLLGSTPELRDLLADYYPQSKIFINDFSWRMIVAMIEYLKIADPEKEIWVKSDWLENPFPDKYFDVVVGDLLLLQFSPEQEPVFLNKINRILSGGGKFIMRCRFRKKLATDINFETVFENAIEQSREPDMERDATLLFWKLVDFSTGDARMVNREKIMSMVERAAASNSHPLFIRVQQKAKCWFENDAVRWAWASPFRNDLRSLLTKYFAIEGEQISGEDDAAGFVIYELAKPV